MDHSYNTIKNIQEVPAYKISPDKLISKYRKIRSFTVELLDPLSSEDACGQSMPDCSPAKWHAAHTSWFFETFILKNILVSFNPFDLEYEYLFNSYYNSIGEQYPREQRGLITRPSLARILEYRKFVDREMCKVMQRTDVNFTNLINLGLEHEQQHQELLLMDIKNLFSRNPCLPAYKKIKLIENKHSAIDWVEFKSEEHNLGYDGSEFHFDNETPVHRQIIPSFKIASRLITNGEYLDFINDGGYRDSNLWLSDGWSYISKNNINHPLYWSKKNNYWNEFTLTGITEISPDTPVCHVSFFEADAFATWLNCRLPTEYELEIAAKSAAPKQQEVSMHPSGGNHKFLNDFYSNTWQWTNSAYLPYPGFKTASGAIGEYNGKFMSNQMVLKGSSCVTPKNHSRHSYRNFFYPHQRWPFTGIRLACNN